jgi:sodium-dependent dicarboxylate transporter 2/3/5
MASDEAGDRPVERPPEPEEGRPGGIRTRLPVLLIALAAATVAAAVAPGAWPIGEGTVNVSYEDAPPLSQPVVVGDTAEASFSGNSGPAELTVILPEGVPVDAPVKATITVLLDGAPVVASAADVSITLVLPNGAEEIVPVLGGDEVGNLTASRRPPVNAAAVLGLLGLVVVLWVSEAFPLFVTSLLVPVVLVVTGVAEAGPALAPFFDPIIALFFGGFLMAEAMRRVSLDHLAAISIVARAGRSPALLFAAMAGTAAFLSMWMSNTAAVAVMLPIAMAVTAPLDSEGYRKALVLGIAYAATIGGVGSAIGTPANPLAIEFLEDFANRTISFVQWFAYGLPMVVLFLPVMGVYLWRHSKATVDRSRFSEARRLATGELAAVGRPTRDQLVVLGVFVVVVLVWLTQTWNGLNTGIVAVGGAVALAMLGKVLPSDLGRISWASLLTFGGGLTLGLFLVESGTADWIASRLGGLASVPALVSLAVLAAVTLALTAVASNTAAAAMLIPLAIPLAGILGLDPVVTVVVVAIASSVDFALVIGTPPTMLAYSTGLFTARYVFRTGIVLDVAGLAILVTVVIGIWELLGVV